MPPSTSSASGSAQKLRVTLVVLAYFVVSIALVFFNKILMTSGDYTVSAPLFITWFQCVLTALIIFVAGRSAVGAAPDSWLREFPLVWTDWRVAVKVLPLSVVFVLMITLNNLCLKYVTVPFYNVARSLTIVANVIFSFTILNERTSFRVMLTLLVVILGFWIGVEGELDFSLIGTLFGVASSCFVSLNAIYTKKMMPYVDGDKWKLSWYNNLNASIMFVPLILLSGEYEVLMSRFDVLTLPYYWVLMTVAGVLGFGIGIVTVMVINITSPLTFNIAGTVKACVQTILAIIVFAAATSFQGLLGIFITIFGSALYTYVKMAENDANAKAAAGGAGANASIPLKEIPRDYASAQQQQPNDEDDLSEIDRLLPNNNNASRQA